MEEGSTDRVQRTTAFIMAMRTSGGQFNQRGDFTASLRSIMLISSIIDTEMRRMTLPDNIIHEHSQVWMIHQFMRHEEWAWPRAASICLARPGFSLPARVRMRRWVKARSQATPWRL